MSDRSSDRKRSRGYSDSEDDDADLNIDRKVAAVKQPPLDGSGSNKADKRVPQNHEVTDSSSQQASNGNGGRFHDIASLEDDVNLPEYVKQNSNTLTFPEKVRRW